MSPEPELGPILRPWLRDRTATPSGAGLARALDRVAATPQRRPRRMGLRLPRSTGRPTATRLVAATAIVTLGTGAVLLSAGGVPSPPAGPLLVTEPVAPGVVRVLGVRETSAPTAPWVFRLDEPGDTAMNHTGIGPDGDVWVQSLVPNDDARLPTTWVAGPTYRITPSR